MLYNELQNSAQSRTKHGIEIKLAVGCFGRISRKKTMAKLKMLKGRGIVVCEENGN